MGEAVFRDHPPVISFFLPNLSGGGAERSFLNLTSSLIERGYGVDLVLCKWEGPLRSQVPVEVRVVPLEASGKLLGRAYALRAQASGVLHLMRPFLFSKNPFRQLSYLPGLIDYLRARRPNVLLTRMPPLNIMAVWARALARVETRVVVTEGNMMSLNTDFADRRYFPRFLSMVGSTYSRADAIIAISDGVAADLSKLTGIPREKIETIHNPAITENLTNKAEQPVDHPWFEPGGPPVILGVGRLHRQKDFPTLIRAFARVRAAREARLMILGDSKKPQRRSDLLELAADLGVAEDVSLPGFVENPYAYMARASVFVLSSAWEGFGNVVAEALACGCPVVSTDCPSGPAEILDKGRFGALVPVGDDAALADFIESTLDDPPDPERLRARSRMFEVGLAADRYLKVCLPPESIA